MKIKKFNESYNEDYYNKYKIGDYVIVDEYTTHIKLKEHINNKKVGQIINPSDETIKHWGNTHYPYYIRFDEEELDDYNLNVFFYFGIRPYKENEIVFADPDKEIVEAYLESNKYNL